MLFIWVALSIWKVLVYLISGAVSNIVQPHSQGFSRFEADQRSMFESANGGYVIVRVHVFDQKSVAGSVVVFSE